MFNKIDRISDEKVASLREKSAELVPIFISAAHGEGVSDLKQIIEKKLDEVSSHVIENVKQTKQKLDEINARNNFNSNNEDPEKTIDTKPNRNSTVDRKIAKEGPRGEEPKLEIPAPTEEEGEAAAQEIANVIISAIKMALKEGLENIEYDELQSFIRLEEQYRDGVIVFEDYEKEKVRIHDKAVQDRLAAILGITPPSK